MKIWYGYGSEHSANLVMIGHFKDVTDATRAKEVIDRLTEQVHVDSEDGLMEIGSQTDRYTDGMMDLLRTLSVYDVGPSELEQLAYDVRVKVEGQQVVITTDESDVTAFLKVLIDKGARVDVYSAHDYPGTDGSDGE